MYITVSRKSDNFIKRFSKYISIFLPDVKYIPRGDTPLSKIFTDAIFLGHSYFLLVKTKDKDKVSLLVYKRKGQDLVPEKEIEFRIFEMKKNISIKEINQIKSQEDFADQGKIFYFIDCKKKGDYGLFLDDAIKQMYSFKYNKEDLGFFLNVINIKKIKVNKFD